MRKEPFSIDNYVHVYNRGNRKQLIVHNIRDKDHFLQMLYYFNAERIPIATFRELVKQRFNLCKFEWPKEWQPRKPIVNIVAFALLENHFHLLLKEVVEGGIAKFMQKLGTGMTMYYNTKYKESGSLFQGSYKARCVNDDLYLKYLSIYIQVKNTLELYPGGLKKAIKEFNKAYDWAVSYSYCSLGDFIGKTNRGIIDKEIFAEIFSNSKEYKEFAHECMLGMNLEEKLKLEDLILE